MSQILALVTGLRLERKEMRTLEARGDDGGLWEGDGGECRDTSQKHLRFHALLAPIEDRCISGLSCPLQSSRKSLWLAGDLDR